VTNELLEYMRAVYNYKQHRLSRAQIAERLSRTRWWYHWAPLELKCRQTSFVPRAPAARASFFGKLCNHTHAAVFLQRPMVTAALSEHGYWLARNVICDASVRRTLPQYEPDNSWVEVIRVATSSCTSAEGRCEGGRAGCWFSKAAGSGIFLNTGRSLRVATRAALARVLRLNTSETFGLYLRGKRLRPFAHLPLDETEHLLHEDHLSRVRAAPPWPPLSVRELVAGQRLFAANRVVLDYAVCEHVRKANFDTVQLWDPKCGLDVCFPEVVSCHPGCADVPSGSVRGGCVPETVPLRTGWVAELPCHCNQSVPILNCMGHKDPLSIAPAPRPSTSATAETFLKLPPCVVSGGSWIPGGSKSVRLHRARRKAPKTAGEGTGKAQQPTVH
jgi:hypothetical protein